MDKGLSILVFLLISSTSVFSQQSTLPEIFQKIESDYSVNIHFQNSDLEGIYRVYDESLSLGEGLRELLHGTGLIFLTLSADEMYILPADLFNNYSYKYLQLNKSFSELSLPNFTLSDPALGDVMYKLEGTITQSQSSEVLPGVSVIVTSEEGQEYSISELDGSYSFSLKPGRYTLETRMTGFQAESLDIALFSDIEKNLTLYEETVYLNEFTITANKNNSPSTNESSTMQLSVESIKTIPPAFGEVDVIKSISSLPGVSNVGEGTSGFNVRGGNIDQNLILLDGAPVYNSGHLFGFFSIFNPDALEGFKLYKGAIPSSFGGRASSVLTISLKNPELEELHIGGSSGILSSRLRIESPLSKKNGLSFLVAGRIAYPNLVMSQSIESRINQSSASYSDVTAKVSYKPKGKNFNLSTSLYLSQDEFSFRPDTLYGWTNQIANFNLNNSLGNGLFLNTHIHLSNYNNKIDGHYTNSEYNYSSSVNDIGLKSVLAKDNPNLSFETGVEIKRIQIDLGEIAPEGSSSSIVPYETGIEKGLESALFAEVSKEISPRLSLTGGLRYSLFARIGESNEYTYNTDYSKDSRRITDTTFYENGQLYGFNSGLEPRISGKLTINPTSSVKFSYNLLRQYMLLISNTAAQSPVDIWKLSGPNLNSQLNHIWSIGYFKEIANPALNLSFEFYYKKLKNNIGYKEGAELTLNQNLETELINGSGKSYGMEMLLNKIEGKSTGWISYTFSRSFSRLSGEFLEEQINQGEYFPSNFDKPHILNVVYSYNFSSRLSSSLNFVYNSGRPITVPESAYYYNGSIIANYLKRNQERVPDYHRLDLSVTLENKKKKSRDWETSWTFSLYNVYGRKNPFSVYFSTIRDGRLPQAYKLSVLGSIIPALTFNFDLK